MANDLEQSRHDSVIAKRRVENERLEQSTEAFKNALKKVFKNELTDEEKRVKIHQETQNGRKGLGQNPEMARIARATQGLGLFGDLDDVETGFEKRYWETENDG